MLRTFIGLGYYDTITPSVIRRCLFENPSWYTPYTPYQAEIAQGRLESLLNFQTMVTDLTGMPVASASLLDEATAAGEAMTLLHRVSPKKPADGGVFLVSDRVFPQTLAVLQSRAEPLGIDAARRSRRQLAARRPGGVRRRSCSTPTTTGAVVDIGPLIAAAHAAKVLVAVATDLLALTLLTPPGELGADVVVGNSQRFGVPLGFGGPHAAFFATRQEFVRHAPGPPHRRVGGRARAAGLPHGAADARAAHPPREGDLEHLHRAGAARQHGGDVRRLPRPRRSHGDRPRVHGLTRTLAGRLAALGVRAGERALLRHAARDADAAQARRRAARREAAGYNLRHVDDTGIGISLDETTTMADVDALVQVFAAAVGKPAPAAAALGRRRRAATRRCAARRRS